MPWQTRALDEEIKWVSFDGVTLPKNARKTYFYSHNYIGRAKQDGALVPGTVNEFTKKCTIAWKGEIYKKTEFEVLTFSEQLSWEYTSLKDFNFSDSFKGGHDNGFMYDDPLYIGRYYDYIQGSFGVKDFFIGSILASDYSLTVGYGDVIKTKTACEVLKVYTK